MEERPAIQIRPCEDSNVPQLMTFIDRHWRQGHILSHDRALLDWQFAPSRGKSMGFPGPTVLLAWNGQAIVGILGLIPFQLNLSGRVSPAAWLSLWLVTPEARRSTAGLDLLRKAQEMGFKAIFGVGMNDTVKRVYSTLGFEVMDEVPMRLLKPEHKI